MPVHLLHGDSFLVPQRLSELIVESGAADVLDANRHRMIGSQTKPGELLSMCNALPFMDDYRLVIVEGLLGTAEPKGRSARRGPAGGATGGSTKETSVASQWKALGDAIPQMPDTTVLVFTDGVIKATNPMLRMLKPLANDEDLPAPKGEELARWVKSAAEERGAFISPAAIRSITDLVGSDLWTLTQELEKLSLYCAGRQIEESDVNEMVSQVREASIFAAIDAMIDGRPGVALRLLHRLKEDGQDASQIIGMVERQLRLLALARDSIDRGLPQSEMRGRLGTTSDFVVRKTTEQARRHPMPDIITRYNRLLETDLAIKRGKLAPDLALELLAGDSVAGPG
ncbi:MAG: DNA polymerase III subunit delta [Chloroflexi bacterium]|nr:DNA polymerase III subunit delta [Chloroflexota bacterium]MDA1271442.1 DNA polymerase III subunit delta [Chloroflexota bacterium]PKB58983.1 MAG: DNA polymerase III subunit delta [SAR202 cluster bacterium Casp-Chloro-G2]